MLFLVVNHLKKWSVNFESFETSSVPPRHPLDIKRFGAETAHALSRRCSLRKQGQTAARRMLSKCETVSVVADSDVGRNLTNAQEPPPTTSMPAELR
jgi:hypothetical protein